MTLTDIAQLVETFGIPTLFAGLALYIGYLLATGAYSDHKRIGEFSESIHERYFELNAKHAELEKKFTACREENAILRGQTALLEQSQSYAVDEFLDETQDFDKEIQAIRAAMASLKEKMQIEIDTRDKLIAKQEEIIAKLQSGL